MLVMLPWVVLVMAVLWLMARLPWIWALIWVILDSRLLTVALRLYAHVFLMLVLVAILVSYAVAAIEATKSVLPMAGLLAPCLLGCVFVTILVFPPGTATKMFILLCRSAMSFERNVAMMRKLFLIIVPWLKESGRGTQASLRSRCWFPWVGEIWAELFVYLKCAPPWHWSHHDYQMLQHNDHHEEEQGQINNNDYSPTTPDHR